MIFDAIILENFGAYGGHQEALLSPQEGRPLVLFGGMNGGGKTTMLDAFQLVLYGPRARISNRGKLSYKDYLRDSIHRGTDPSEGAGITLRFRRLIEGVLHNFALSRHWRLGIKGIEERIHVQRDGQHDAMFTEHWDEVIEAYLPSSIAHLFFFDGEQIKDLAEGGHAAEILGTAIHSLLGLDLVDRLEGDLKVLERRKRAESIDETAAVEFAHLRDAAAGLDREQERLANEEGRLVNESGRIAKEVQACEEQFRAEGGELFEQRRQLEERQASLRSDRAAAAAALRGLAAGPLPLLLIEQILRAAVRLARSEQEARLAKTMVQVLVKRDADLLAALKHDAVTPAALGVIERRLQLDRAQRSETAEHRMILDAPDSLAPQLEHTCDVVLPKAEADARSLLLKLARLGEQLARVDADLERVPAADRIGKLQADLKAARAAYASKLNELQLAKLQREDVRKKQLVLEEKLDRVGASQVEGLLTADDRARMLKHAGKARTTLRRFREAVVRRHTENLEALMLESFQKLLRKTDLIAGLKISPVNFETTLLGRDGHVIPVDRLSAGERQLLATSMLWGLARASGRPIPTVIDTPLGRLDSEHRSHLIERYFPNASHQVFLLSTDEEIAGDYYEALKPAISRSYVLEHEDKNGRTQIKEGYFA